MNHTPNTLTRVYTDACAKCKIEFTSDNPCVRHDGVIPASENVYNTDLYTNGICGYCVKTFKLKLKLYFVKLQGVYSSGGAVLVAANSKLEAEALAVKAVSENGYCHGDLWPISVDEVYIPNAPKALFFQGAVE